MSPALNTSFVTPAWVTSSQFPPSADLKRVAGGGGELRLIGSSLVLARMTDFFDATTPDAGDVWEEAVAEINLKFIAWTAGLAPIGDVRVLESSDDVWSCGDIIAEETLGSVWIHA